MRRLRSRTGYGRLHAAYLHLWRLTLSRPDAVREHTRRLRHNLHPAGREELPCRLLHRWRQHVFAQPARPPEAARPEVDFGIGDARLQIRQRIYGRGEHCRVEHRIVDARRCDYHPLRLANLTLRRAERVALHRFPQVPLHCCVCRHRAITTNSAGPRQSPVRWRSTSFRWRIGAVFAMSD